MARLDARWLNFWQRGQAWYSFWQDGPPAPPAISGTGVVTQAAAVVAGVAREAFKATGSVAQTAVVLAAIGREDFRATGAASQAAAVIASTGRERFIGTGAVAQAPAAIMGSESERFIGQGVVAQSAVAISGSGTVAAVAISVTGGGAGRKGRAYNPIRLTYPVRLTERIAAQRITASGHIEHAAATLSARGEVSDADEWLVLLEAA